MAAEHPVHIFQDPGDQDKHIEREKDLCVKNYGRDVLDPFMSNSNSSMCPAVWDGILCWPNTHANTLALQLCPHFIAGFDRPNNATRQCMEDGRWFVQQQLNTTWTNYSECFSGGFATVVMEVPGLNASLIQEYMPIIKVMSRIGYSVSFSTLIVAFCIMFFIKRLHCARNKLHMHLFASFIFRAFMGFLKDILFINGVGMSSDVLMKDGGTYFVEQEETNNWGCKMFISFWQYFITANYSWILMEGLYLHNLILLALFSDSNNSIRYYIILGWGLPALVVGPWVLARLILDDTFCWTTHSYTSLFLMIRIPTMVSNLINLILFINIARVLFLKLRSPVSEEARTYRRWARSTLVLVPLFGVHYALFLGMSYSMGINETVELIWLFCDQLFASFQGFFVAILYCFLNGEVRTELRPYINNITSAWFSVFFNCGEFSRSTRGRPSVCTTLSCSSLYNSSVTHKYQNRKCKWEQQSTLKGRHSIIHECPNCQVNGKQCYDVSPCWNSQYQHQCDSSTPLKCQDHYCDIGNKPTTEQICPGNHDRKCKPQQSLDLEMITMANH